MRRSYVYGFMAAMAGLTALVVSWVGVSDAGAYAIAAAALILSLLVVFAIELSNTPRSPRISRR